MDVREKLKNFLKENGLQQKWFAEKIGINPHTFYVILQQGKPFPKKYWKAIILLTNREISIYDLAEIDIEEVRQELKKPTKKRKLN